MMEDCIFCKIINGSVRSQKILENEFCLVIRDIAPHAEFHALVLPKKHIRSLNDWSVEEQTFWGGQLLRAVHEVVEQEEIKARGYRLIVNTEKGAGQTVFHLHFHILAGAQVSERLI